jgi:hypothetical protein
MARLIRSTVPILFVAFVLAGVPASSSVPTHPSALPDCLGNPTSRPHSIVFACADANFGARHLRWTGWGERFAAAVGVAYANDCDPTCVEGTFHRYRAIVAASGTQECAGGVSAYEKVTIAFVGPSPYPAARVRDLIYTFSCQ